jgi:hypothetical protein
MEENELWKLAKARVEFKHHLRTFVFVSILLWGIYFLVNFPKSEWGSPWPLYPMLIWGAVIAFHGYKVYFKMTDDPVKREFDKLKRRQQKDKDQDKE